MKQYSLILENSKRARWFPFNWISFSVCYCHRSYSIVISNDKKHLFCCLSSAFLFYLPPIDKVLIKNTIEKVLQNSDGQTSEVGAIIGNSCGKTEIILVIIVTVSYGVCLCVFVFWLTRPCTFLTVCVCVSCLVL